MPKVTPKNVTSTQAKPAATRKKPKADSVADKAAASKPKSRSPKSTAAEAVVNKQEPKTITIRLPAGARRVENPEVPDILKGMPGVTVKEAFVFEVPRTLQVSQPANPANVGADNGPKGSNGWVLGNAHAKQDGAWLVSDAQVGALKDAVRPLMEKVLKANGYSATGTSKISLPERFRDPLDSLIAERKGAGLPTYPDRNYYPVQIEMKDGRIWETAVHPNDLNGGASGGSKVSPNFAMRLGKQLQDITDPNHVPRNISRADVEGAAATLRAGVDEVKAAVQGTRGIQAGWGGETVSAARLSGMADALELLALKMKQAGI